MAPKKKGAVASKNSKASTANKKRATRTKTATVQQERVKDINKLLLRNAIDNMRSRKAWLTDNNKKQPKPKDEEMNLAQSRLKALAIRDKMQPLTPVTPGASNWLPLGPLAVPNGQTYGGVRVLISGRVTSVVPHPTNVNTMYIGTARGGVWKSTDAGANWSPLTDNAPSLAIGALAISKSNPDVLYAGTGEGNLQYYSTVYALSSAPGVYLGVGVLKSTDGGASWSNTGSALFNNQSFYNIAVDPTNEQRVFAASSKGLCRTTTGGGTWTQLTGGGLPTISASIIACTDVLIDAADATGNTVYAAFWGAGVYRSTNALAASPTWTQITSGLPTSGISRISLAQSPSMNSKIVALIATSGDAFKGVYQTTDATGLNWSQIISAGISVYGAFTSDIMVDISTPNTLYVSGVELYKCVFSAGSWSVTNVGSKIHPDSHSVASHPTNNAIIYSGNDGGVYKTADGGTNWDDSFNEGLCLLQYEAMDQHPTSDAFAIGGTQDNGTEAFRNSPVFYHAADGDGGYCNISPTNPKNVVHSYYSNSFERSTSGGKFGTWANVSGGISGSGLFYPPCAISPTSERMAVGTDRINIAENQGSGAWTSVTLSGISGRVSAVSFASNIIIYAGTTSGQVYRLDNTGGTTWTVRLLSQAPLPTGNWLWDISAVPGNVNLVVAVFSGFGIQHVWKGTVPASGAATWTAISGSGGGALPDIPMYAAALKTSTEFYVGTDIGVFATNNGGSSWFNYNQGLPNTAVYDMRYNDTTKLLRAATHGRGLWEINTATATAPDRDLFFRDNLMQTGRFNSSGSVVAAWEDPLNYVNLGDTLYWWNCADIKVDSPNGGYQFTTPISYLDFEYRLQHQDSERGNTNHVYVQVHNRGPLAATNVKVKIMFANASAGLPPLPADFWTTFPNSAGDANWTPVGSPQTIATLNPLKPEVLEWDWKPPVSANSHTCMLVVMDSASDPIPAANKVFDIGTLVTKEKRAGLRNLHVVNLLPDEPAVIDFYFHGNIEDLITIGFSKDAWLKDLQLEILLPKKSFDAILKNKSLEGFTTVKFDKTLAKRVQNNFVEREHRTNDYMKSLTTELDWSRSVRLDPAARKLAISKLALPKGKLRALLVINPGKQSRQGSFSVVQYNSKGEISGGSTFVLNPVKQ